MRPLAVLVTLTLVGSASAHPLPNFRFDRTIHVRTTATSVRVQYTLQINAWTMVFDSRGLLTKEDEVRIGGREKEFAKHYLAKKAPLLADNLYLTLDGQQVPFRVEKLTTEPDREHLKFRFDFRADWQPKGGPHAFQFEDMTFDGQSGVLTLTLDKSDDMALDDVIEPTDLRGRSPLDWKPGDEIRSRKASAAFVMPGEPTPTHSVTETPTTIVEVVETEKPSLVRDVFDRGLVALFDTEAGTGFLLLVATLYGMAHAFAPGHGKAMMAAYLIGERGTFWHVLTLGVTTTVTHTGSVTFLAFALGTVFPAGVPTQAEGVLQLVGGSVILAVGVWLLSRRLRGSSEALPVFAESFNPHAFCCGKPAVEAGYQPVCGRADEMPTPTASTTFVEEKPGGGWLRTILLGVGSGLIPCWGAIILLVFAISAGRLSAAFPLLAAFSLGLAFVLVMLGTAVLLTLRSGGRQFASKRWFRHLPAVSAGCLIVLSLYHAWGGAEKLLAPDDGRPAATR